MTESIVLERVVEGLGVSPGIGVGVAYVCEAGKPRIPEYRIRYADVAIEQRRLRGAILKARRQIGRLRGKARARAQTVPGLAAQELIYLLEAYQQILKDSRLVRGAQSRIIHEQVNAEAAVQMELGTICEGFRSIQDPYLAARIDDIREVGNRILAQLTRSPGKLLLTIPSGCILVAEEVTPADTAQLDPEHVIGIAAQMGGAQGHTAIMARALGLPAVLGAPGLLDVVRTGDPLLIDGDLGRVVIHPSARSLSVYRRRCGKRRLEERNLQRLATKPAVTRDGVAVRLQANVELPIEMDHVLAVGACGIGLLRTEFLFMNRTVPPDEEEQFEVLRSIVMRAGGQPVTMRTLDLGGDKGEACFVHQFGDSVTSALGVRGIRLSLARTELLEVQLRAMLRASAFGPVRILLPMVTSVSEVRAAREILARAARRLHQRGVEFPTALPPVGTMIEVPAAVLIADALTQISEFFAIGSNDLTMYTLAIDRADERVAHLYNPLHPAVLRLIQLTVDAARRAHIPVSICGEIAGDPRFAPLLLGLGLQELSMAASSIPRVKRRIVNTNLAAATAMAATILQESDPVRIQILLDENEEGDEEG